VPQPLFTEADDGGLWRPRGRIWAGFHLAVRRPVDPAGTDRNQSHNYHDHRLWDVHGQASWTMSRVDEEPQTRLC